MLTTKQLEQMNNSEFEEYCKKEYQPFFNCLECQNIKYYLKNKFVYIVDINKEELVFNNIELPPNTSFNFCDDIEFIQPVNIALINYPRENLSQTINISLTSSNKNLKIAKSLSIIDSPKLKEVPDNFILSGSLIMKNSSIKKIGKNVKINEHLNAMNSALEEIGDNLIVGGHLNLNNSQIKKLGKNTKVNYSFFANNTKLKILDSSLYVEGDIYISNIQKLIIADKFSAKGDLNINCSSFEKIGEKIKIIGNLKLINCDSINFSTKIVVLGGIFLENSTNVVIPDNMCIKSLVIKNDSNNIIKLGKNITIENNLSITDKNFKNLPEGIIVGCTVNIEKTKIKRLPLSLKNTRFIYISETFIENIDEFSSSSVKIKYQSDHRIVSQENLIDIAKHNKINYIFNSLDDQEFFLKNILLYNVSESIHKKLLLEQFNEITKEEIQKFIHNKNSYVLLKESLDKKEIKLSSDNQESLQIKVKFMMIYYCRSKQAFNFLYKNGYYFSQKEYKIIKELSNDFEKDIINLYEVFLIKYNINKEKK